VLILYFFPFEAVWSYFKEHRNKIEKAPD